MVWWRALAVCEILTAISAALGGLALMVGAVLGIAGLTLPAEMLAGSPFDSYLLPGLVLLVVVAGVHGLAFVLLLRRHPLSLAAAGVAGCGLLIWIFVQMTIIPFSLLQLAYFAAGLAELVLVMLILDVLHARVRVPRPVEARN